MKLLLPILLLFCCSAAKSQGFYDLATVQTIEITFSQSNWGQLLDNAYPSGEYVMAQSVTINGETLDSVGVKYKGNSTYQANQAKNPFHIELDTYKDHQYDGYTDIKLSNIAKDPSFIREVLSYQILRQYMDAPLSNYANVFVNGERIGLYSNSESIGRKFVDKHYGSKDNARFKCSPPDGAGPQSNDLPNLVYLGQDSTAYYEGYELKSDGGWAELIDLCDTLVNHTENIDAVLDVDRVLWMLAFDNVLVNLDSYLGRFTQNYYLYRDDHNRFLATVWDLNESLGVFSDAGTVRYNNTQQKAQMPHLLHLNDADWPLVSELLAVPQYRRKYLAHVKTMLEETFASGLYEDMAVSLRATIDADVQADPNKLFTYANFLSSLNSDVGGGGPGGGGPGGGSTPGITTLMDARADYLLGLSDFNQAQPAFDFIVFSNEEPALNSTITLTATITDALRAYLNYRTVTGAPFTTVEMFDDGEHGDGAANDGVFGTELTLSAATTEYYLYAENDGVGRFAPRRAEHEFFTIAAGATSTLAGDLVINEFLASNETTRADQDGEFDDWIELYNNTSDPISLDGFFLSDDTGNLNKWAFPEGSSIDGNGYLIIWADQDVAQDGLHADFRLSAGGESVVLTDGNLAIVDSISYTDQVTDVSFGRFENGTGDFQLMPPTFNAENSGGDVELPDYEVSDLAGQLVINELMADNETTEADQDGEFEDWIELYNNFNATISLNGFSLSDDVNEPAKWSFPAGTAIASGAYLMIWADEDLDQAGLHADFRLAAGGETLFLFDDEGALVDSVTYADQTADISHGRFPNGTGPFIDMTPTFAAENNDGIVSTRYLPLNGVQLTVFPNPTRGAFTVRLTEAYGEDLQINLYAADGRALLTRTLRQGDAVTAIATNNLPDGLYLLAVTDGLGTATHKVVVRR